MADADPADQEVEKIFTAVGRALTAWSHVEESLCAIFVRIIVADSMASVPYAQASFWAIESFWGRLNMIDAALKLRCEQMPECLKAWTKIYNRARTTNNSRNELAHGTVMNFGRAVETYFVPSFFKSLTLEVVRTMQVIAAEQAKGGPGSLELDIRPKYRLTGKQVEDRERSFRIFKIRLDRFYQDLNDALR